MAKGSDGSRLSPQKKLCSLTTAILFSMLPQEKANMLLVSMFQAGHMQYYRVYDAEWAIK